jgi:hypothetical protein
MSNLPTIAEISEMAVKESDKKGALNVLLNQDPPQAFIQVHPFNKNPYIAIQSIEFLMTKIFGDWNVEVKRESLIANSVCVTVRVHYKCPLSGDKLFQDGVGAQPLQTDKGANAVDFTAIKNDSVQKALPSAESYAIKDACQKIGKIFGKDIARKYSNNYDGMMPEAVKEYKFDSTPQLTEK